MFLALASSLLLIGQVDAPLVPAEQLRELIRAKSAPLKSLVFVYDGKDRWIGDPKLVVEDVRIYDRDLNGTFLYRSDQAALCDVYATSFAHGGVVRKKTSLLKNRLELTEDILDAKQKIGPEDIKKYPGFLFSLNKRDAPLDLNPLWELQDLIDSLYHEVAVEGWDVVAGRTCLRVRLCTFLTISRAEDNDCERDKRFYWLDLERNAQALKAEVYRHGNLESRIDQIQLVERSLADKTSYWLPVSSRTQSFGLSGKGDRYSKEPVFERTFAVVNGSERINLSLPDSLFTVTRNSAYPTPKELAGIESRVTSGPLARQFQGQEPPPPYRTDPVSVRKRIEDGLAEANRQSKELEASSPARQAWSGTTLAQIGVGVVGVALLGFVAVRKWRGA